MMFRAVVKLGGTRDVIPDFIPREILGDPVKVVKHQVTNFKNFKISLESLKFYDDVVRKHIFTTPFGGREVLYTISISDKLYILKDKIIVIYSPLDDLKDEIVCDEDYRINVAWIGYSITSEDDMDYLYAHKFYTEDKLNSSCKFLLCLNNEEGLSPVALHSRVDNLVYVKDNLAHAEYMRSFLESSVDKYEIKFDYIKYLSPQAHAEFDSMLEYTDWEWDKLENDCIYLKKRDEK